MRRKFIFFSLMLLLFVWCGFASGDFEDVRKLIEAERYDEALERLEEIAGAAVEVDVKGWCYYQMGEIHYNWTHTYAQALEAYDKILELEKEGLAVEEVWLANLKRGDVQCRLGRHEDAIESYGMLVQRAPVSHFVHKTGLRRVRDIRGALSDVRERRRVAVEYKGTALGAMAAFEVAELYRNPGLLNQPELAIAAYESLLEAYPDALVAPETAWRIGRLRDDVFHQSGLAMAAYRKVVEVYPSSAFAAEALYQMGSMHREAGKFSLAIPVFEKLKRRYPNFWNMAAVVYWLGVCYEGVLNYGSAIETYQEFVGVYLPSLDGVYLGQISMYDKSVSEVKALVDRKIGELGERIWEVELTRLDKAMDEGDFSEALGIARDLVAKAPNTPEAKEALGHVWRLEQLSAIERLQERLEVRGLSLVAVASTWLEIGGIYEREPLSDYSKALGAYRAVSEKHRDLTYAAEALYRSGRIYGVSLSSPDEAIGMYKRVVSGYPKTLQAMRANFALGELYRDLNRYDAALAAYRAVVRYPERARYLEGGYKDSFVERARFRTGCVYYEAGRYGEARFAFEGFIEGGEGSPRVGAAYVYLAVICEAEGEVAQAVYYLKRAEEVLLGDGLQLSMVLEESGGLADLRGLDSDGVLRFLRDSRERLGIEKVDSDK